MVHVPTPMHVSFPTSSGISESRSLEIDIKDSREEIKNKARMNVLRTRIRVAMTPYGFGEGDEEVAWQ